MSITFVLQVVALDKSGMINQCEISSKINCKPPLLPFLENVGHNYVVSPEAFRGWFRELVRSCIDKHDMANIDQDKGASGENTKSGSDRISQDKKLLGLIGLLELIRLSGIIDLIGRVNRIGLRELVGVSA